ncbi:MAG: NB-ARC domain-containing protein [Cyanobacteria bacterium P01_C01_bin.70]
MSKRQRGVVLTEYGLGKLEAAIAAAQDAEKFGNRFTQAEIEERVGSSRKTIKKIRDRSAPVDKASVEALFSAFGLKLETADFGQLEPTAPQRTSTTKIDWGEKPDTAIFFGRSEDLTTLNQWIQAEQCRVVTLLGMGGIGKTSLAAKLADQIYEQFDYVIWRSLREAPPLDEILVRLIQFLSDQQETEINLPSRLGERIIRLLHYLREHRCLLVLDNLESILQAESTGQFRDGYEGYGELIHRIGEAEHQSCLLLTSRECPRELAPMAGDRFPVRLWSVTGIDTEAGREILKTKGLELDEADTQGQELIDRYSGNPQALHLVATAIQREFLGDVDDFLEEEGAAVEDVRSLLDQHLTRLAPLERSILFWLAINREPVGLDELMEDLLPPVTKREVRSALRGLSDRYLIETVGKQFTLQNVIMEFATDRFVERVSEELNTQKFDLFHTHALIKATAKDYVHKTQIRLVLKPISIFLESKFLNMEALFESLVSVMTGNFNSFARLSYLSGNCLNLVSCVKKKISGIDLSNKAILQADLSRINLLDVNFNNSKFINCKFIRFSEGVSAIEVNCDGSVIAIGYKSGKIDIWRSSNLEKSLSIPEESSGPILSLSFNYLGSFLASSNQSSHEIKIWCVSTGKCLKVLSGHRAQVRTVLFSPKFNQLASSSDDKTIRLWNISKGNQIATFNNYKWTTDSISFDTSGDRIIGSSWDKSVRGWNIESGECIAEWQKIIGIRRQSAWTVSFVDNIFVASSGSEDGSIKIWDISNGKCWKILNENVDRIWSVHFNHSGHVLATIKGSNLSIGLWSTKTAKLIDSLNGHNAQVNLLAFSSDDSTLVSSSVDQNIKVWDLKSGVCRSSLETYMNITNAVDINFSKNLLIAGGTDQIVRIWDIESGNFIKNIEGHSGNITSVAMSSNENTLASADSGGIVKIWHLSTGRCLYTFVGHYNSVKSIAFGQDEETLFSVGSDGIVNHWSIKTGKLLSTLQKRDSSISAFSLNSKKNIFATSIWSENYIMVQDAIDSRKAVTTLKSSLGSICSIAFSSNGENLFVVNEFADLEVWSISKKKRLETFKISSSEDKSMITLGSHGKAVAVDHEKFISVLKLGNNNAYFKEVCRFEAHKDNVVSLCFHENNRFLVSTGKDESIKLWKLGQDKAGCIRIFRATKPYEGMNITGTTGLTEAQRTSLVALGAINCSSENG